VKLFVFFLVFCKVSFAQISIENLDLTKPDTNVLIYGYENKLKVKGVKLDEVQFVSSRSKVKRILEGYSLNIDKSDFDTITIYQDGEVVYEKIFYVNKCTESTYLVSGSLDTILTKEILLKTPELFYTSHHCLMKSNKMIIRSYDVKIVRNNIDILKENATIKFYSKSLESAISQLVARDKIIFSNVVIYNGDVCPRKFPKKTIWIK
jgi:hypothetical protein